VDTFTVDIDKRDNGVVAHLRGNASNNQANILHEALAGILQDRPSPVVIDVDALDFIASAALAELINFRQNLRVYGGRLRLAGARDQIADVLRTTHLADLFPMFRNADDALGAG
jgi:anti-anti-sigma factor